ncbi:MAG: glutamyl-tRNA reductase [Candidatus Competibacteraceae bacterium]|nr:glutamyl-tRNA reductase [Candidatus Competibacteraceae bacterium]MCB1803579.1 glutamyl-tRNA reductase [Candidatus Competibacteraceae bacterium]MCB1811361.1 glutamyl-tRNA reductase [Candidatus Competibacteraceae bacterium]
MPLLALGINHKTAPVTIREQVAFPPERLSTALLDLRTNGGAHEAAILSTCNRTELYCNLASSDDAQRAVNWLSHYHALPLDQLQHYMYHYPDQKAVRHMLRVASGLDSMVLGEPQILGQVKTAYQAANKAGTLGSLLERLFQHTFSVAKRVRTDTAIGESPVSVAFAAVSLSKQIFADLSKQKALLIGAGETIELVARHLYENKIHRIIVANRTFERARSLATHYGGYAISLDEIPLHLAEADIVISSTASSTTLLDYDLVRQALIARRHRPMFMVDIAVPRDIDPKVAELADAYLYTVDDLQDIIAENIRSRQAAAKQAEEIVDTQVDHFMAWLRAQSSVNHIRSLRAQGEAVRDEVLARAMTQLQQGKDPAQALQFLANTLTNKLLHAPSTGLRQAAEQGDVELEETIKRLFKLPG